MGTYLTEDDFAFIFEKRDDGIILRRAGRKDVLLEREAGNIFHQKTDPAFKQAFTTGSKGEMVVTAYHTTHAPYSLTRAMAMDDEFEKLEGSFSSSEISSTIGIRHLEGITYEVTFRNQSRATGLLISSSKMLVDSYSLEFEGNDLYLNGARIKKVKFVRE